VIANRFPGRWISRVAAKHFPTQIYGSKPSLFTSVVAHERADAPQKFQRPSAFFRDILDAAAQAGKENTDIKRLTSAMHRRSEVRIKAESGHF
jgi:hypothetical protein